MSDLEPLDDEAEALLAAGRVEIEPEAGAMDRVARHIAHERRPFWRRSTITVALAASFALGAGLHALAQPAPPPPARTAQVNPVPPPILGAALGDNGGRAVLDEAARRLMSGDAAGAIAELDEHARLHAAGPYTELREALYVEAYARAGRAVEARARGARFFEKYPTSLLGPAVRDALGRISDE